MNNFNFIYDKVASSLKLNVYFIASSTINIYNIPKSINDKFQFFQFIKQLIKIIEVIILDLSVIKLELKFI